MPYLCILRGREETYFVIKTQGPRCHRCLLRKLTGCILLAIQVLPPFARSISYDVTSYARPFRCNLGILQKSGSPVPDAIPNQSAIAYSILADPMLFYDCKPDQKDFLVREVSFRIKRVFPFFRFLE